MPSINPFPERLPDDKAQQIAERRTAAIKEQAGLFAEFVELVTPEMVQAGVKAHHDSFDELQRDLEERARRFRSLLGTLITPEELAAVEERLKCLPDCPAYRCDNYRQALLKLGVVPPAE